MKTGAFVCSCADACDVDLDGVRESVDGVDVVATSSMLCEDGLSAMAQVVEEYDLDQLILTAPDPGCRETFRSLAAETGLHTEATSFVDHRESVAWVHDAEAATEKTARLINARHAGLQAESVSRSVSREAGDRVAVVGDADAAAMLSGSSDADVVLVADGAELADVDADLEDVTVERGRVVRTDGRFGEFDLTLRARVTDDCISCMDCVREGPDGAITRQPVDVAPEADGGEWVDVCPTDAIDLDGVERTVSVDQVVYPGADERTRGGRIGFYTGPVDAGTLASVQQHLGGIEKPAHLELDMDVCAAGASSQRGCTACVDACPHGAVDRPRADEVSFDEVACQNCGACTASCPTGAVQLREPSNERIAREVEALLEPTSAGSWFGGGDAIDRQVVAFVCSERAARTLREYGRLAGASRADVSYPPILPVEVNCADTVGEAHVMHALAAGAEGVAVVGCGDACLHSGPDPKAEFVERLNAATTDLGLGERVAFAAPEPGEWEAFAASLESFYDDLDPSPLPAGEHEAAGRTEATGRPEATGGVEESERSNPAFDSHGWTLESVRTILEHVDPKREVVRGLKDFGRMAVSDDCAVTPTCTTMCPTDAIRRTEDADIQFNHERCVGCGLCEEGCPEGAITMRDGLDLSSLPENREGDEPGWRTVYEGEMLACIRCETPFTTRETADRVRAEVDDRVADIAPTAEASIFEYCDDCRSKLLFENR